MNFDKMVYGTELSHSDSLRVLAGYCHRFTRDNKPQWASRPMNNGKYPPVQFDSDKDWLRHTRFTVKGDGTLDNRSRECYSVPTWPDNPELRVIPQRIVIGE